MFLKMNSIVCLTHDLLLCWCVLALHSLSWGICCVLVTCVTCYKDNNNYNNIMCIMSMQLAVYSVPYSRHHCKCVYTFIKQNLADLLSCCNTNRNMSQRFVLLLCTSLLDTVKLLNMTVNVRSDFVACGLRGFPKSCMCSDLYRSWSRGGISLITSGIIFLSWPSWTEKLFEIKTFWTLESAATN